MYGIKHGLDYEIKLGLLYILYEAAATLPVPIPFFFIQYSSIQDLYKKKAPSVFDTYMSLNWINFSFGSVEFGLLTSF